MKKEWSYFIKLLRCIEVFLYCKNSKPKRILFSLMYSTGVIVGIGVVGGIGVVTGGARGVLLVGIGIGIQIVIILLLDDYFRNFFIYKVYTLLQKNTLKKYTLFQTYLPPSKLEEIIGDLTEMRAQLQEAGYHPWTIWRIMTFQKIVIYFSIQKERILDWVSQKTKINN